MVESIKLILIFIIPILVFYLVKNTSFRSMDLKENTVSLLNTKLTGVRGGYFSYSRIEAYLKQNGKDSTPSEFILIKIGFAFIGLLVGLREANIFLSILLSSGAFFIPDYLVSSSNKKDNVRITNDLKSVYDTLRIQTKAGVYINDALTECYLVVKNERLKNALLQLSSEIRAKKSVEDAINEFNSKFKNPYIDTFCVVIEQSLESGKSVQLLEDLSEQIIDIEDAMTIIREEKAESKLNRIQFFIFIGVIAIVLYGLFVELMSAFMNF